VSLKVFAGAAVVGLFAAAAGDHLRSAPARAADEVPGAARLVALVEDVAEEYAEAHEERPEAALAVAAVAREARTVALASPATRALAPRLEQVARAIRALRPPVEVEDACAAIAGEVIARGHVVQAPAREPDLARGARVYAAACAGCHGAGGHPDPRVAAGMETPPPDLHDPSAMNGLSPARAYRAVSFGVRGTAMPEFPTLSAEDRWAVAFYTMAIRQPACARGAARPALPLAARATADDNQLVARFGESALACLRR
jgi:high-affinity iron transporter